MTTTEAVGIANILIALAEKAQASGSAEITREQLQAAFAAEDGAIARLEALLKP